jgi:hypothetical protein
VAAIRHGMKYGLIQAMKDGHVNIATHPLRIPDSKLAREVKEIVRDTQKKRQTKMTIPARNAGPNGMYFRYGFDVALELKIEASTRVLETWH